VNPLIQRIWSYTIDVPLSGKAAEGHLSVAGWTADALGIDS
jgi:hypothetical protein